MSFTLEQPCLSHSHKFLDGSPSRTWDSVPRAALESLTLYCLWLCCPTPPLGPRVQRPHSSGKESLIRCSKRPESVTCPQRLLTPSQVPLGYHSLVIWICSEIQSSGYSRQIAPLERSRHAAESGAGVCGPCASVVGTGDSSLPQAPAWDSRAEGRGNVGGRGTKKARGTKGWDKPLAVVGERPLVAPGGLGPPSLWNALMLMKTIIRWVWDLWALGWEGQRSGAPEEVGEVDLGWPRPAAA